MTDTCSNCRYWRANHSESKMGLCRRFPPQVVSYVETRGDDSIETHTTSEFPITVKDGWCGDHSRERVLSVRRSVTTSQLIRDAANVIRENITVAGIKEYIQRVAPQRKLKQASLSALVSQISKEEGWAQVQAGTGGEPSIYNL